jgi:hypothetical protein
MKHHKNIIRTSVGFLALALTACLLLSGCGKSATPISSSQIVAPKTKVDKWSWLPKTTKHDAALAQVPKDAEIDLTIPKDEPLEAGGGLFKIDERGNPIMPDDDSYVVKGGALVSKLGAIEKKAMWGGWDFIYADSARTQKVAFGNSLTSGEVLLPRELLLDPPTNRIVQNAFEIESFGDKYVLIRLNQAKGHRLCFMQDGRAKIPTAGYIGSKAEVDGKVLERKADGWYSGTTKLSE